MTGGLFVCYLRLEAIALVVVPAARQKRAGYHRASQIDDGGRGRSVDTNIDRAHAVMPLNRNRSNFNRTAQAGLTAAQYQAGCESGCGRTWPSCRGNPRPFPRERAAVRLRAGRMSRVEKKT